MCQSFLIPERISVDKEEILLSCSTSSATSSNGREKVYDMKSSTNNIFGSSIGIVDRCLINRGP